MRRKSADDAAFFARHFQGPRQPAPLGHCQERRAWVVVACLRFESLYVKTLGGTAFRLDRRRRVL